ncbi:MAG: hypothetical protein JXA43_03085 [Candidatus Diapherotrites archaeon]|nr:hypothetical protein [Candidatus Diapherotrites archaeon]
MRAGRLILLLLILPFFVNAYECNVDITNYTTDTTVSASSSILYKIYVANKGSDTIDLIFTTNSPYSYDIDPLTKSLSPGRGQWVDFRVYVPSSASNGQKQINFNAVRYDGSTSCVNEGYLSLYVINGSGNTTSDSLSYENVEITNWPSDMSSLAGQSLTFGFVLKNRSYDGISVDVGLDTRIKWECDTTNVYLGPYDSKNIQFTVYPTNNDAGNNTVKFFANYKGHTLRKELGLLVYETTEANDKTITEPITQIGQLTLETKDLERKIVGNNVENEFTLVVKNENPFDTVAEEIVVEDIPEDWSVKIERDSFMVFSGEIAETKIKIIPIGETRDATAKISIYYAGQKTGTTTIEINEELTPLGGSGLFLGASGGVLQAVLAIVGAVLLIMFISNLVRRYEYERTTKEQELAKRKQEEQMRHYF